jgi:hypothetical protein
MASWILSFARWAYRVSTDDPRRPGRRTVAILALLPIILGAVFATTVAPQFVKEFKSFALGTPALTYDYRRWHVVYGDSWNREISLAACENNPLCLARPENPILWQSHYRRADRDQHFERLSRMPGHAYWLGLVIPAEDRAEARRLGYSQFLLGQLNGAFEIYLNGRLFRKSGEEPLRHPLILSQLDHFLPNDAGPLHLAVKVTHNLGSPYPDILTDPVRAGFASPEAVSFYSRAEVFERQSAPFFFAGVFFSLGVFLLLVWITSKEKMEYSAVAAFSLLHGVQAALAMSLVYANLGESLAARARVLLWGLEFTVVALLGLTLSRARFTLIGRIVPVLGALAFAPVLFVRNPFTLVEMGEVVSNGILLPMAFFFSAFLCFAQFKLLRADHLLAKLEENRHQRLGAYTAMFVAMGTLHLGHFLFLYRGLGMEPAVYRYASVLFVVAMGTLAVKRNGDLTKLMSRGIMSRYHRRLDLPEKVSGALLSIDLKGSEALYRLGASEGQGGLLVNECLGKMWAVALRHEGEIVDTQGDAITILFEGPRAEVFKRAVRATQAINDALAEFSEAAWGPKLQAALPGGRLRFRAAVSFGSLRPIWQTVQATSQPGWIEAEDSNPFVDAARLLEVEKELNGRDTSLLVADASAIAEFVAFAEAEGFRVAFQRKSCLAKHEKIYSVTGLHPVDKVGGNRKREEEKSA